MAAILRKSFSEVRGQPDLWGRFVECAVGAHLFEGAAARGLELFYWREGDREVDFVLRKGGDVLAIEVKSGRSRTSGGGLEAFKKKYKSAKMVHVGREGISVENFLLSDIRKLF